MANITVNLDPRNIGYFSKRQDELARLIRESGYISGIIPSFYHNRTLSSLAILRDYSKGLGRILPMHEVIGELDYACYTEGKFVHRSP